MANSGTCKACGERKLRRITLPSGGWYYAEWDSRQPHVCDGNLMPSALLQGEPTTSVAVVEPSKPEPTQSDWLEWVGFVHAVRHSLERHELRYVASPRAILGGITLIAAGISRPRVAEMVLWRGMPRDDRERVISDLRYLPGIPDELLSVEPVQPVDGFARYGELKAAIKARVNIMLVGPAGAGKTTVARQIANELGMAFKSMSCAATTSKDDVMGFRSAVDGAVIRGFVRDPYEFGGIALLDEIDACNPDGLLGMNQVAANGHAGFDDGEIDRHPDFVLIASANTFGRGADRVYVGRQELDAATLDRYAVIEWDYDEVAEVEWARELAAKLIPAAY